MDIKPDLELTTNEQAYLKFYEAVENALAQYASGLQDEARQEKHHDPNRELDRRFGKEFSMEFSMETDVEIRKPSQLQLTIEFIRENQERWGLTDEQLIEEEKAAALNS